LLKINPQKIEGNWRSGYALDIHTISSTPAGVNEAGHTVFDTVRSPIGELLYKLKYNADMTVADEIIATAVNFLSPHRAKFNLIIPVPPSSFRKVPPVITLANGIGARLSIPVVECVTTTRPPTQLKGVTDLEERKKLLTGLYAVDTRGTEGKNVLLFDDLFRSGATMNAITDLLIRVGKVSSVRALTITRTRSNQ